MKRCKKLFKIFKAHSIIPIPCFPIVLALTLFCVLPILRTDAIGADLTLVWKSKSDSNLAGYRVYYGTCSGIYTSRIDAGKATRFTLSNLKDGQIYYLAITAYDYQGNDGRFSEEVIYNPILVGAEATSIPVRIKEVFRF